MTTKHNRERLLRSGARADKVIFLIAVVATCVIVYWS